MVQRPVKGTVCEETTKRTAEKSELEVVGYEIVRGGTSTGNSAITTSDPALTRKTNGTEAVKGTQKQTAEKSELEVVGYRRAGGTSTGNSATTTSDLALTRKTNGTEAV